MQGGEARSLLDPQQRHAAAEHLSNSKRSDRDVRPPAMMAPSGQAGAGVGAGAASSAPSPGGAAPTKVKIRLGQTAGGPGGDAGQPAVAIAGQHPLTPAATPYSASSTPAAGGVPGNIMSSGTSDALEASTPRQQQQQGKGASIAGGHTAQAPGKAEAMKEEDLAGGHQAEEHEHEQEQEQDRAEQLQRDLLELPPIARQHLVPLYEIVRRVVARAYSELQSLVEV